MAHCVWTTTLLVVTTIAAVTSTTQRDGDRVYVSRKNLGYTLQRVSTIHVQTAMERRKTKQFRGAEANRTTWLVGSSGACTLAHFIYQWQLFCQPSTRPTSSYLRSILVPLAGRTPACLDVPTRSGRIFGNRIQSNDYFEVIGVTDYRSQKVIVTKYPDPLVRPDAAG